MRFKIPIAVVGGAALAASVLIGPSSVAAAGTTYTFVGYAGGSTVRALNSTVTSDLTAASSINGPGVGGQTNSAAGVTVPSVLTTKAVTTSSASKVIPGGYEVTSEAKTAGVSVLGGAITVDAIDSISTTTLVNGTTTGTVSTTLVGLKIAGFTLPVKIPQNYHLTIPNVASVYLNYAAKVTNGDTGLTLGTGVYLSLLKPVGGNGVGAAVSVNPTYAAVTPLIAPATGHAVGGNAYGTQVTAKVGQLLNVNSDPTAPVAVPFNGTSGATRTSSIAAVTIAAALHVGAVTNTATGTNTNALADSHTTSQVAGVNLLNGLIKADALSSDARVQAPTGGSVKVTGSARLVNLTIAGKVIPINAAPNTTITIANVARVVVNQQIGSHNAIIVRVLDITLSTAAYGLPAGAEVQVATSYAAAA